MARAVRSQRLTYIGGYVPQSEAALIDAFAKTRLTQKGKPISRTVAVRMLCLMGLEREGLLLGDVSSVADESAGQP